MKVEYTDEQLLNWAMNQMYRAARTLDLCSIGAKIQSNDLIIQGLDLVAEKVLRRLKETPTGLELVKRTNPKLLTQQHHYEE